VEKRERGERRAARVAMPQEVQQKRRPVHSLWRKAQEHSGTQSMPPKGTVLEKKE